MPKIYKGRNWRIGVGGVIPMLRAMPAKLAHLIVTSPPYYMARRYGCPDVFGGLADCEHRWGDAKRFKVQSGGTGEASSGQMGNRGTQGDAQQHVETATCQKCGAWSGELGHEDTPDQFVNHLADVFNAAYHTLRDDGSLWVNLGDTYDDRGLRGIPWKFALEMQSRGWNLRSEIIWAKSTSGAKRLGSPMPQSLSGWQWMRCRVKIGGRKAAKAGTMHAEAPLGDSHGARAENGKDFERRTKW